MQLNDFRLRLAALTLLHFIVDFYGGLLTPLPEPTLVNHLGTSLFAVMALLAIWSAVVNFIQPVIGALLPSRGIPGILLVGPLLAAVVSLIGLTDNYWLVGILMIISAIGTGALHPEAALTVHTLTEKRQGLALSIFMSGGYFGYASGSLVSGRWAKEFGLNHFWILGFFGLLVTAFILLTKTHKLSVHQEKHPPKSQQHPIHFANIFFMALCIAANMVVLGRFLPILFFRLYGPDGQVAGGDSIFATGLAGAIGSWLWGHLSEKYGRGKTIAIAQVIGLPMIYFLINPISESTVRLFAFGVGLTLGGVFPLSVVLARGAQGLSQRLRMGLAIGGAWGFSDLLTLPTTWYIDSFDGQSPEPVERALCICWILLAISFVLAIRVALLEKRHGMVQPHTDQPPTSEA